jgi:hypothetical protein
MLGQNHHHHDSRLTVSSCCQLVYNPPTGLLSLYMYLHTGSGSFKKWESPVQYECVPSKGFAGHMIEGFINRRIWLYITRLFQITCSHTYLQSRLCYLTGDLKLICVIFDIIERIRLNVYLFRSLSSVMCYLNNSHGKVVSVSFEPSPSAQLQYLIAM